MSSKSHSYLAFHKIVEAESACDGKQDGKNGNNGEQCAVSQCRSFVYQSVFGETVNAEVDCFDNIIEGEGVDHLSEPYVTIQALAVYPPTWSEQLS